ncbi:MAG: ABC transporter permease [Chloroflexi bacterium]|nr:ABC transporter permease [Chloroflexota bacterium]
MAIQDAAELVAIRRRQRPFAIRFSKGILRFIRRKPLGAVGLFIILLMGFLAAAQPWVTFYDPNKFALKEAIQAPSLAHWLGTDDYGRDLWTRIVLGAQISLMVGFGSVAMGSLSGALIGIVSAYYGGKVDTGIQRVMDALMSIPTLILALTIMAALGQSTFNVILAIAIPQLPRSNRVVRSAALSVKNSEFAMAARAIGATDLRIMAQHIMPQCVAPWIIIATASLGVAIISESSLSFLGLGVPPPHPSWGGMLSGRAREFYAVAPWLAIWPGVAVSMAVYGFNLFGDAIRDVLDPRLRGS